MCLCLVLCLDLCDVAGFVFSLCAWVFFVVVDVGCG